MSLLFPFEFPSGSWLRPARSGEKWVLWLPPGYTPPIGWAKWFKASGGRLVDSAPEGSEGNRAFLLACPRWVGQAMASAIPQPPGHGSRTPGNLLPW